MEDPNNTSKNGFLGGIYDDFFSLVTSNPDNIDKAKAKEKFMDAVLNEQQVKINFPNETVQAETKPEDTIDPTSKEDKLNEFYEEIDNLSLSDESKETFKKIVTYAYKYDAKIAKTYIAFNLRIYVDNSEVLNQVTDTLFRQLSFFNYINKDGYIAERSLYDIEDASTLSGLYVKSNSMVILRNVEALSNKDSSTRDKLLNSLENLIKSNDKEQGILTIIADIDKSKIDKLFSTNLSLKSKVFDYELYTTKESIQEINQKILSKLSENFSISDDFNIKLLDYITETYETSELTSPEYANQLIEKILLNQSGSDLTADAIPAYDRTKTIEEIFEELDSLVGLQNVKESLHELVSLMEFKSKTSDKIKLKDTNLHMVFLGNPGTGKTTVARMIAGILYNLKYIDNNKLIEVSAKDLIGQYVGQTAPKTMEVINQALGGVLFIDEAYSLASTPGSNNSFNEECVATLIQAMENYRDNLIVIFAGYSKEMDGFLKSNSGIVSRIGYTFEFKDYTTDELIKILQQNFKKAGFTVDKKALEKAANIIDEYRGTQGFGNARFARNLYEKAVIKHASNTKDVKSIRALRKITEEDITDENLIKM